VRDKLRAAISTYAEASVDRHYENKLLALRSPFGQRMDLPAEALLGLRSRSGCFGRLRSIASATERGVGAKAGIALSLTAEGGSLIAMTAF